MSAGWGGVFLQHKLFPDAAFCRMFRDPDLDELLSHTLMVVSFPQCVIDRD